VGTPKSGGNLNAASWQEPDSFLGAGITDSGTHFYADVNPVMEGLLVAKANQDVKPSALSGSGSNLAVVNAAAAGTVNYTDYWAPQLATKVPTVENGAVKINGTKMDVTWDLRKGVKWHDGEAFTSKDVKATYQFFWLKYGAKNPTPILSSAGWDRVESVDTPDDNTAVVHFKSIYGPYLTLGSGPYGIMAAHLLEKTWAAGGDMTATKLDIDLSAVGGFKGKDTWDKWMVGTGPFVFKEWVSGDHMTLVKNPNWWGANLTANAGSGSALAASGRPYLDSITVKFEPDTNTQLADLRTNTIDFGEDFRGSLLPALAHIQNTTALTLPDAGGEKIDLNVKNPFLADVAVRKAMNQGFDKQSIVDTLLQGKTQVLQDGNVLCVPNSSGEWCNDPSTPKTKFDPAAAKKTLEAAGYKKLTSGADKGFYSKDGKTPIAVNLVTTSGNALREQQEVVFANNMAFIGIRVIQPFNNPKAGKLFGSFANGGVLYNHTFDMALYTNTYAAPGEPDSFYQGYRCDQIPSTANRGQGQNSTQICDAELDKAMEDGRSIALKQSDRKDAYVRAQKRLAELLPEIVIYQQLTIMGINNKVHGYKGNDNFWMNNMEDVYLS
jgi:peptide/nickel transport system substrate-binding protein